MGGLTSQVLVAVDDLSRAIAAADAALITGRPNDAVPEFFKVCVRPLAQPTGTHWIAVTYLRPSQVQALALLESKYPLSQWVLLVDDGAPVTTWKAALADLGYVLAHTPTDDGLGG